MASLKKSPDITNFCQAIRGGDVKSVEDFIKTHWPSGLSHTFNFDILLRRMTSDEDAYSTSNNDEVDAGPKVHFKI